MNSARAVDFAQIAMALHGEDGETATLDRIAELACETVDSDMCGIMLVRRGRRVETAAVTDERVRRADEWQLELDEGPCLEAIDKDAVFIIDDTATETRWQPWCAKVAELGVVSVLSVRLFTQHKTIGCLNIYSSQRAHFDAADAQIGIIFAGHASVAIAAARTEAELRDAIDSRHTIGLAQGMLMERFDLDQEQSFSVLQRYSQDRNVKLRSVAGHLVQTRQLPE